MDIRERYQGCLLGLAVGDAVGMSVEHWPPGSFEPLTGMEGGGPFDRPAGHWTDDTAMALCLATSLLEQNGFDPLDQMRWYARWAQGDYLGDTKTRLDIGGTVASALFDFRETGKPYAGSTDPASAGNGCIMRLAPIPMFFLPDLKVTEQYAGDSSRTTHGAIECIDACRLLGRILWRALCGYPQAEVAYGDRPSFAGADRIVSIARGEYVEKPASAIQGTGYVVDSLEAAMWCFVRSSTFEEAILAAANLGSDADTTAAVCGQVAGAYYGASDIPPRWLSQLLMRKEITALADRLCDRVVGTDPGKAAGE